jgi:hypothetical protein
MGITSSAASVKNITIRMHKRDSAFVYAVLESHEGLCSYSTLPLEPGATHLDMILRAPDETASAELRTVLKQLGDIVHELVEQPDHEGT